MTDKFTIEQFKAAVLKQRPNFDQKYINDIPELDYLVQQVIAELTRPTYMPQVGEITMALTATNHEYPDDRFTKNAKMRPLSYDEVPWAKVLKDALEHMQRHCLEGERFLYDPSNDINTALATVAKMRGESE